MDNSKNNIKLGIFIIFISIIFTFVILKVSGGNGLINNDITVYAEFNNVKGLLTGNIVRYSGVKIGHVSNIKVKSDKIMIISMSLDKEVQTYMKSDSEADISTDGLVGNMLINITPGLGDAPFIKDEDKIGTKQNLEMTKMLETLASTNDKIALIAESMLQITEKINNGSGSISLLINDEILAQDLKNTTRNLSITSANIKTSTNRINSMIVNVEEGEGNLGYLLKDNSLKTQMDQLTNNLDSLINDRVEPIMKNLEISSKTIANTTKELESIVKNIDEGNGLLSTVMNDTIITQDLKNTIDNLNKGTQKFDESMEALQHHWLLRGFFKKKLKKEEKAKKDKEKEESNHKE